MAASFSGQFLNTLALYKNKLTGTYPGTLAALARLLQLEFLENPLAGSLPDSISSWQSLRQFGVGMTGLEGSLPENVASMTSLEFALLYDNKLTGRIPDSIEPLARLWRFYFWNNSFAGALPHGCRGLRNLEDLWGVQNQLSGSIPHGLTMAPLMVLMLWENRISRSLPRSLSEWRDAAVVHLGKNRLSGALPEGLRSLTWLQQWDMGENRLEGSIPSCFSLMRMMKGVLFSQNKLVGTLPDSFAAMLSLQALDLSHNALSGALPSALLSLANLHGVDCSKTDMEGTLPLGLGHLAQLASLIISAGERSSGMRGPLPLSLSRLAGLQHILAQGHELEGPIPSFISTLAVMVLHDNNLQLLLGLTLNVSAVVLLHRNRLSCKLPHGTLSSVKTSLVAIGNHLTHDAMEDFPGWVSPFEQDGLFWIRSDAGFWVLLKFGICAVGSCLVILKRPGLRKCVSITYRWHHAGHVQGLVAKLATSFFSFMVRQALESCLLLFMLMVTSDFFVCPGTLSLFSSCVSTSVYAQTIVVLLWGGFCCQAKHPWWIGATLTREKMPLHALLAKALAWACWLVLAISLSGLVALNVAAKCIVSPLFMPASWMKLLDVGIGVVQGLISAVGIPTLARQLAAGMLSLRQPAMIGAAGILSTCLIPAVVVLFLDIECAGRWTHWWTPCRRRAQSGMFDIQVPGPLSGRLPLSILSSRDVCTPAKHVSAASCARSVALKLHDIMLSKLVMSVLVIPSAKLLIRRPYRRADKLIVKLVLLLELGMMLGSCLPLIVPFLCIGILAEGLLAAVSWDQRALQGVATPGAVRFAVLMTGTCSVLFHCCFVSENSAASSVLYLVLLYCLHLGCQSEHQCHIPMVTTRARVTSRTSSTGSP